MTIAAETTRDTHGERVRLRILEMGVQLWRVDPSYVTARRIAHELQMTHSAVLYHFGHIIALKDAVAYHAVKQGESRVIVHLIAGNHAAVASMSDAERQEHMRLAR
jgi:AcrR family transcriptional regulator